MLCNLMSLSQHGIFKSRFCAIFSKVHKLINSTLLWHIVVKKCMVRWETLGSPANELVSWSLLNEVIYARPCLGLLLPPIILIWVLLIYLGIFIQLGSFRLEASSRGQKGTKSKAKKKENVQSFFLLSVKKELTQNPGRIAENLIGLAEGES